MKPVNISDFYPKDAREADEQGPVVVEFTVPGKAASPTDIKVVASRLVTSPGPGRGAGGGRDDHEQPVRENQRYRLRLNFQLEE